MKTILGLDLGTNSIGWALIKHDFENKEGKIIKIGSRILPMSQDILGKFNSGQSISQTAERTRLRSTRRLLERDLLRRERLHRVLNKINFLPKHYADEIDFEHRLGQFQKSKEPKLAFYEIEPKKFQFIFKNSFNEMLDDFKNNQPELVSGDKKVPYDWTIYYLRKKALTQKIEKEELSWILLNFNQKRGYYQLRGEEEDAENNKSIKFYSLKVINVEASDPGKAKDEIWYNVFLENGWIYRRSSKIFLDWKDKTKDFIVTEDLNEDGSIKTFADGKEKRSFKAVDSELDWIAIKKSTEEKLEKSNKTVGAYIYETLLTKPDQKVRGKLIRTIERKFYKDELKSILKEQAKHHPELQNHELYKICIEELYAFNDAHKNNIANKDFTYLFMDDIIFYQRPLKSKKSLISNCPMEKREFKTKNGALLSETIKCVAKSHPLFQEFRLLQFLNNLRIFKKEELNDIDITNTLIPNEEERFKLYLWLNDKTDVDQKGFLSYFNLGKNADQYRWNYVEEKKYPLNETRGEILKRLNKIGIKQDFLTAEVEQHLWHILYSVEGKIEIEKALKKFAKKYNIQSESFIELFKKYPRINKEYGALSLKAIKKLLPLMRFGKNWCEKDIIDNMDIYQQNIKEVINKIEEKASTKSQDQKWVSKIAEKLLALDANINDFKGLHKDVASYLVYKRDSEIANVNFWKRPEDIELLKQHSLRNPIVEQVINETLQTIKDIWTEYGKGKESFFDEIHIELSRELKNPADKRAHITQTISENENTNIRIKGLLIEMLNDENIENVRPYSPMQQEILKLYEEGVYENETNEKTLEEISNIRKQTEPSPNELKRYKLWLEQGYISPYTGKIIPLTKLFTPAYEIEHIIPQSRFFDDSLSNKIICEAEVNSIKDNQLAYEFIKNNPGLKIELSKGNFVEILDLANYEQHVKKYFGNKKVKLKKLLMEDIPESFIERQLNDSRYISKVVKNLLSHIVRQEGEEEGTAKNVIVTNGSITSTLRQDWGINDIWTELITPRFQRLNHLTNTENFGTINPKTNKFLPAIPLDLSKGFSKKRIDHRHHAIDALIVACTGRNHVNYLNNESAKEKNKEERFDLRNKLKRVETIDARKWERGEWITRKISVGKEFLKPWLSFSKDAKDELYNTVVSFKKNNRVINKTINYYQSWEIQTDGAVKKVFKKQIKGDNWAIRKPLHKDTVSGLVNLKLKKTVSLTSAIDYFENIVDKPLRNKISHLISEGYDKKKIMKLFKDNENKFDNSDVSKVEIFYYSNENSKERLAASRVKLDDTFNEKKIKTITDHGIHKILLKHLENYKEIKDEKGREIAPETLAFSADGIDALNKNIVELNNGQFHKPIFKVRTFETLGNKFVVGNMGNKKNKFVEAAKGTNLFFAIYLDTNGKRSYETIPLNVVIENQKLGALNKEKPYECSVPKQNEFGHKLKFYLSPNDLVYLPTVNETKDPNLVNLEKFNKDQLGRIYKFVSSTGNRAYFLQANVATSIVNKVEFSPLNKMEKSIDDIMIKSECWKIEMNRLGNTLSIIK